MPQPPPHQKILIINIFGIGDVLFTTPLIHNIKESIPGVFIGYICNKRAACVLEGNPHVDKLFIYEKDDYRDIYKQSKAAFMRKLMGALSEIKKEKFDTVIDISLNKYSSFLMWLVGIPRRIGFNYKNRSPFLTTKITLNGYEARHVVEYYLGLLEHLKIPVRHRELEIYFKDEDQKWAEMSLAQSGINQNDRLIGIVPGGGASWGKDAIYKRWPIEKYAQLADKIIEKFSAKVILMADKNEKDLTLGVGRMMHRRPLGIYETTLSQLVALFKCCRAVVVNDGGALHLAVAAGVRSVSIFGPVDEVVYGPYPRGNHLVVAKDIACRPCYRRFRMADCLHHQCIHSISVEEVLEKVRESL